ncbi:MAG: hypothetical protein ACI9Y1_001685 [Lentisphaeria bacterium]|jgi:hypothetical protein
MVSQSSAKGNLLYPNVRGLLTTTLRSADCDAMKIKLIDVLRPYIQQDDVKDVLVYTLLRNVHEITSGIHEVTGLTL